MNAMTNEKGEGIQKASGSSQRVEKHDCGYKHCAIRARSDGGSLAGPARSTRTESPTPRTNAALLDFGLNKDGGAGQLTAIK